eukprot:329483-Rhodomonas_salina.2
MARSVQADPEDARKSSTNSRVGTDSEEHLNNTREAQTRSCAVDHVSVGLVAFLNHHLDSRDKADKNRAGQAEQVDRGTTLRAKERSGCVRGGGRGEQAARLGAVRGRGESEGGMRVAGRGGVVDEE